MLRYSRTREESLTGRDRIRASGFLIVIALICLVGILAAIGLYGTVVAPFISGILILLFSLFWLYTKRLTNRHNELIRLLEEKSGKLVVEKERTEAALRAAEESRREAEDQRMITEQAMVIIRENQEDLIMAKNAAEEASRAKSRFLANMSHELRTPLTAIIGYSEMLNEAMQENGDFDSSSDIRKIHRAGKHLLQIIDEILDVSKIEAGKMELYLETFDLSSLIRDLTFTIQPLVQKNRNILHVNTASIPVFMRADEMRLRQILLNLLSNACKFTHNGNIHLEVLRERRDGEDWIVFQVEDSGIGMTHQEIEKLFQFFSQADSSTNRKYGGTGLGLAISKRLCEMMGGEITVKSAPSAGTTFKVRIPAEVQTSRADANSTLAH